MIKYFNIFDGTVDENCKRIFKQICNDRSPESICLFCFCFLFLFFWGGGTQGQVTPMQIVRSCRNSNSYESLCLPKLSATLTKIQSKLNRLCSRQGRIWDIFCTNVQGTPKSIARTGRNSNSSKILCMSRLSASFIKFQFKLSTLCYGQCRIWVLSALTGN